MKQLPYELRIKKNEINVKVQGQLSDFYIFTEWYNEELIVVLLADDYKSDYTHYFSLVKLEDFTKVPNWEKSCKEKIVVDKNGEVWYLLHVSEKERRIKNADN